MNLKLRFALSFTANTLIVIALFGSAYYFLERRLALDAQRQEQLNTIEHVASVCRASTLASNGTVALNYLNALKKEPSIVYATCIDARGRVQAHSDSQWIGRRIDAGTAEPTPRRVLRDAPSLRDGNPVIEWTQGVKVGAETVGVAMVAFDRAILEQRISATLVATLQKLAAIATGTFVIAVFLGLALASNLSRPITRLEEAARAIGEGRWDAPAGDDKRVDEIGRLGREMAAMAQKLKQLDELKDEFISNVSHDLRSPMAAVNMYLDYMLNLDDQRERLSDEQRKMLGLVKDNALRLSVFVTNILDAAKMKAGKMDFNIQPIDVRSALQTVKALFDVVAVNQNLELVLELPPDLPKALADPIHLDQIITNVVSNAIKFTKSGGRVVLSARAADGTVEISVADTGRGMSGEEVANLFQRFRQFGSVQNGAAIKGTGLGLFVTKQTVEAMGGRIAVQSQAGKGSRFTIAFRQEAA